MLQNCSVCVLFAELNSEDDVTMVKTEVEHHLTAVKNAKNGQKIVLMANVQKGCEASKKVKSFERRAQKSSMFFYV